VFTLAAALQRLQLVARRNTQAGALSGGEDLKQLAPDDPLDVAEAGYRATVKKGLGICTGERAEHTILDPP
jgi:hypothetical protein